MVLFIEVSKSLVLFIHGRQKCCCVFPGHLRHGLLVELIKLYSQFDDYALELSSTQGAAPLTVVTATQNEGSPIVFCTPSGEHSIDGGELNRRLIDRGSISQRDLVAAGDGQQIFRGCVDRRWGKILSAVRQQGLSNISNVLALDESLNIEGRQLARLLIQ